MKKAEVVAASTEDLIIELVTMALSSRILKSSQRTANWICQELAARKVVGDAETLYKRWDHLYAW